MWSKALVIIAIWCALTLNMGQTYPQSQGSGQGSGGPCGPPPSGPRPSGPPPSGMPPRNDQGPCGPPPNGTGGPPTTASSG